MEALLQKAQKVQSPNSPPEPKKDTFFRVSPLFPQIRKTLDLQGFQAETEGFEPSCRDEPANAFRVRRVTAASLRLLMWPPVLPGGAFFIILDFSSFVTWFWTIIYLSNIWLRYISHIF